MNKYIKNFISLGFALILSAINTNVFANDLKDNLIEVMKFTGAGPKNSDKFTINGNKFKIAYKCSGMMCNASLREVKGNEELPKDLIMNSPGSVEDETIIHSGGTFYLSAQVMGKFEITVYEFKN